MSTPNGALRVHAHLSGTAAVFTTAEGVSEDLDADGGDIRRVVVDRATVEARETGAFIELVTSGDRGEHRLVVATDGSLTPLAAERAASRSEMREQAWWTDGPPAARPEPDDWAPAGSGDPDVDAQVVETAAIPAEPPPVEPEAPGAELPEPSVERLDLVEPAPASPPPVTGPHVVGSSATESAADDSTGRPSFITPSVEQRSAPITGWRGAFARLGLPVRPSRSALRRAEWEQLVSLQWAECRTIAVANGKGGVGKTMTTAMLAAVFARSGGGNVLAWDNNDTRGTLGWRTEQGLYDTTVRDLLPEARRLLEPTSSVSEIARYVHHQATDRYDVLRSNPELLATDQRITTADFDLLMQVAARYFRLVVFDSGNDESADRWLRMIDSSYQLVVPTLAAPESAESASLLLDALRRRDEHSRRLADQATVIVTQSERSGLAAVNAIAAKFEGHVRAVEIIPFDHALKSGPLRFDALQPRTRDAWMKAAASVAEGM